MRAAARQGQMRPVAVLLAKVLVSVLKRVETTWRCGRLDIVETGSGRGLKGLGLRTGVAVVWLLVRRLVGWLLLRGLVCAIGLPIGVIGEGVGTVHVLQIGVVEQRRDGLSVRTSLVVAKAQIRLLLVHVHVEVVAEIHAVIHVVVHAHDLSRRWGVCLG